MVVDEPAVVAEELATVVEEPAAIANDPAQLAKEPALQGEDSIRAAEKSIAELFNEADTKNAIPVDVLEQLLKGKTHSRQLLLAEC